MKNRGLIFALVVALSFFTGSAAVAQNSAGASIVLAGKLLAGGRATLAVLDAEGRLAPGVEVEFSGGRRKATDATGRLTFQVPGVLGILRVSLSGQTANASATVLEPPQENTDALQILDVRRLVTIGEQFSISGVGFSGAADENHVLVGGEPAIVLAASPVELVCLAAAKVATGPSQLSVEIGGRSAGPAPVTLVNLKISADKSELKAGEQGRLIVHILGTEEPVEIEARSLSPGVVQFVAGGVERQTSQGGARNDASFEMLGVAGGEFAVEARIVPSAQGMVDVEAARRQLLSALPLAPAGWGPRLEKLIEQLDKHPQDGVKVRDALEKMLAQRPEGDFGRRLEAAWKILLNR